MFPDTGGQLWHGQVAPAWQPRQTACIQRCRMGFIAIGADWSCLCSLRSAALDTCLFLGLRVSGGRAAWINPAGRL